MISHAEARALEDSIAHLAKAITRLDDTARKTGSVALRKTLDSLTDRMLTIQRELEYVWSQHSLLSQKQEGATP